MRVPSTVNENCLKAYKPAEIVQNWDWKIPKSLRELCLEHIAQNWPDNPILDEIILQEDKRLLLDILSESLLLELALPKIQDETYWKKCFVKRWPKMASNVKIDDSDGEGRTWKKHYCEMHIKDYLERLRPEDYDPEKV